MAKRIRRILILILALALVCAGGYTAFRTLFPNFSVRNTTQQINKVVEMNKAQKDFILSSEVPLKHDGITLYGTFHAPSNYKSLHLPLIIISHGYGTNSDLPDSLIGGMTGQGYLVYNFDFYGGGPNTRSGDPDMQDMSIQTEKADLEAVLSYWRSQSYVDTSHVYLAGVSHGGLISTMVAAAHPQDVKALLLVAPAFNVHDAVQQGFNALGYTDESQIPQSVTYEGRTIGRRYILDALHYDVTKDQKVYPGPVLIIHGTADNVVPYSYSQAAVKAFPHAQLVTLDGVGHSANAEEAVSALPQIAAFLLQN